MAIDIKTEITGAATEAINALLAEAADAFEKLKAHAPEHLKRAEEIKDNIAGYIKSAATGKIDSSVALEACRRETGALELEALRIVEKVKQEAVRRARRAIDALSDFGLKLAQIAISVAAKSATGGIIDLGGILKG